MSFISGQDQTCKAVKTACMQRSGRRFCFTAVLAVILMLFVLSLPVRVKADDTVITHSAVTCAEVPAYAGTAAVILHNNMPDFYVGEITSDPYVHFSSFDALGRTGCGMACLGAETLPAEQRGEIGDIRPSGWQTVRYDNLIEDRYLFNRCHVIGYQLCGDNATPENLFTGTRYLNAESMLVFENKVADYLNSNAGSHVIYRVSPLYEGDNLVATGVEMEAFSVEDFGAGVCFHVFVYNVQPGIAINYATGDSWEDPTYPPGSAVGAAQVLAGGTAAEPSVITDGATEETSGIREIPQTEEAPHQVSYILNTNTKKFHYPDCPSVLDMKEKNKEEFYGTREEAIARGFDPCGRCNP